MVFIYLPRARAFLGFQQTIAFWDRTIACLFLHLQGFHNYASHCKKRDTMWQLKFISLGILGLVFVLILLYRRSEKFRFHTKYFCFNCLMIFAAMYCLVIGVFHPFDVENFHRARDFVYGALVRLFSIRADVEGLEIFNALKGKNFVIVANHQSSLDMFPILKATPLRTTFLAKKELLFAPLFGIAAWLFDVIFINRGHAKSARDVMDKTAKRIAEKKINVWIFPEGTRSQSGSLLPFKKGAFHLAQQAQLPIVPIVIYDYRSIFNKKNKKFDNGIMKVKVLNPIPTEGTTADDVSQLAENVRQEMLKVFHEHDHSDSQKDASSTNDKKIN